MITFSVSRWILKEKQFLQICLRVQESLRGVRSNVRFPSARARNRKQPCARRETFSQALVQTVPFQDSGHRVRGYITWKAFGAPGYGKTGKNEAHDTNEQKGVTTQCKINYIATLFVVSSFLTSWALLVTSWGLFFPIISQRIHVKNRALNRFKE